MSAVPDFAHKFGLVLKAGNLSRGRVAQAVGIDKSVVSRWASGVQAPTDHNLSLLTEAVARHIKGFTRVDWDLDSVAFTLRIGVEASAAPAPLPLPDKPSIAVLPFANLAGGAGQDYFADGIAEDIITALSRFRSLFVIARNSSFGYRGHAVDIKRVGSELGVRYVLEGSVRQSGDRIRVTAQLIDAGTLAHLWADKYDNRTEDLFDVQDRITEAVAGVLEPTIRQAEIERMRRKRPEHFGAYDYFLRGLALTHVFTREATDAMLANCLQAIVLDPAFAPAHALAVRAYIQRISQGWIADLAKERGEVLALIEAGLRADRTDSFMLATAGQGFAWFAHDLTKAIAHLDEATDINPNDAHALMQSALVRTRTGDTATAIAQLERALRLSPRDSRGYAFFQALALAHQIAGDAMTAVGWARRAVSHNANYHSGWYALAASAAEAGLLDEARAAGRRLLELEPSFSVSGLAGRFPISAPEKFVNFFEALRRAGIPE
jgi:adenylate cyclase